MQILFLKLSILDEEFDNDTTLHFCFSYRLSFALSRFLTFISVVISIFWVIYWFSHIFKENVLIWGWLVFFLFFLFPFLSGSIHDVFSILCVLKFHRIYSMVEYVCVDICNFIYPAQNSMSLLISRLMFFFSSVEMVYVKDIYYYHYYPCPPIISHYLCFAL